MDVSALRLRAPSRALSRRALAPLGALGAAAALIAAVVTCATPSATAAATAAAPSHGAMGAASSLGVSVPAGDGPTTAGAGPGSTGGGTGTTTGTGTSAVSASPAVAHVAPEPDVATAAQVWLTDPGSGARLARQPDLVYQDGDGRGAPFEVTVDPTITYQTMTGFGASITDSSASLIGGSEQRDAIMTALFSPTEGIGLSWLRQPVGSSDYTSQGFYTYDDVDDPGTPGDPDSWQTDTGLSRFSLERDLGAGDTASGRSIPLVQQALALNPQISVMLTPWSAPAWMKSNKSMVGGTLGAEWEGTYAAYLVKVVQAYVAQGIPVSYLSVQNEPDFSPPAYPGMKLTPQQEAAIITALGPRLEAAGLTTKILALDHNWDLESWVRQVLDDPDANRYVAGVAWHGYNDEDPATPENDYAAMSRVHDDYGKETLFTEASGWVDPASGDTADDVFRGTLWWHTHFFAVQAIRNWSQSVSLWNMALDDDYGPRPDGVCESCTGVLTIHADGTFDKNAEYYVLGHFSKFVRPGAERIDSTSNDLLETVAFQNPDGSVVMVAHTLAGSDQDYTFTATLDGRHVTYTLPYDSVATLVLSGPTSVPGDGDGGDDDPDDGGTAPGAGTGPQSFTVVSAPRVTGTPRVGAPLLASPGTYSVSGVRTSYQWLRRGAPVAGATEATYTPSPADLGAVLSVKVTASRPGYRPMTAVSTATSLVQRGVIGVRRKPVVKVGHKKAKRAKVHARLKVTHGSYAPSGKVRYRWLRGTKAIKHATKARYRVTARDHGKRLRVRVTVRKPGYVPKKVLTRVVKIR